MLIILGATLSSPINSYAGENDTASKAVIPNVPAKPLGLKIRLDYALLGTASVVFKNGMDSYSSAETLEKPPAAAPAMAPSGMLTCYIGSFGTMTGVEKRENQNFLWKNGGGKTSATIPFQENTAGGVVHIGPVKRRGHGPRFPEVPTPAIPPFPLPPVPQPPKVAYKVDEVPLDCGSGDYIVSNSKITSSQDIDGTLRIFLQNIKITRGPALEISGTLNNIPRDKTRPGRANIAFAGKPQSLQIYYDGDGIIKLNDGAKFTGIIYAPRARIELGRCEVWGAIVGRDVVADQVARVHYDRELQKISEW
ncbi:MAG: hypothetical protein P4L53_26685 [Candidatus Obscuribacterales bacterium]|nr:hypothetical protein [Candidatus Obscuribacterales bacterium]